MKWNIPNPESFTVSKDSTPDIYAFYDTEQKSVIVGINNESYQYEYSCQAQTLLTNTESTLVAIGNILNGEERVISLGIITVPKSQLGNPTIASLTSLKTHTEPQLRILKNGYIGVIDLRDVRVIDGEHCPYMFHFDDENYWQF